MIRPSRIFAIAQLDLTSELRGRGGWILPVVVTCLLVPIAAAPAPSLQVVIPTIPVSGDVPDSIRALKTVRVSNKAPVHFTQTESTLLVRGTPTREIRDTLDGDDPVVRVERVETPTRVPGRTLLLALISASGLTGAVASSIAGERSNRTLVALLTASVSRTEVVLGKWLAWGGLGVLSATAAATGALIGGRVEPGWWLLCFPLVPLSLAAAGLWLVRSANDVVGGTATALRILPTAVSLLGITAWFLGRWSPNLGAAIPLGGALVAAGNTWEDPLPNVIAAVATTWLVVAALIGIARDLDETPTPDTIDGNLPIQLFLLTGICLGPTVGPLLWERGGNPDLLEGLDPVVGRMGAGFGLMLFAAIALARRPSVPRLSTVGCLAAVAGGLLIARLCPIYPTSFAHRMPDALPLAAGAVVAIGEELAFRGWLKNRVGAPAALGVWMLLRGIGDPLGAALTGLSATAMTARWGLLTAIVFRVVATSMH